MDPFQLLSTGTKFNKKYKEKPKEAKLDFFSDASIEAASGALTEEEAQQLLKEHNIKTTGTDIPFPIRSFNDLESFKIKKYLKTNVEELYTKPTPIQMQAIPIALHKRELMACAPTGSGKTLAFLYGLLHNLKGPQKDGFRGVIITPTRELAQQIKKLTRNKPFKVVVLSKQVAVGDILISTPLRLVNAIQEKAISLNKVEQLILDEADKLLELGFLEQMDEIFAACSCPTLIKSMFSATLPSNVEELAKTIMKDPIRVIIGLKNTATEDIEQKLLYVGEEAGKLIAMRQLIQQGFKPPCLVFVQSIERAKELFHELIYDGINVDVIHSERTQAQRDAIITQFRTGKIWVLISTELMSRGIDFKGVEMVINYDFPQTIASYIHRIGRTGRAGKKGLAITYFTKEDAPYLKSIVNVMRDSGADVPDWMLNLKKPTRNMKKNLKQKPLGRDQIKTISSYDEKKIKRKNEMVQASKRRKVTNE